MRSYGNHWMAWNDDSKEWDIPGDRVGFILAVKLAVGTAQSHMRWWYTIDEVLSDEDSI